jgi:DNA-binding transcriptional LysR family regulator
LLPDFEPGPVPVHVLHRQGRRPNAKVRALLDLLIERLRANPALN